MLFKRVNLLCYAIINLNEMALKWRFKVYRRISGTMFWSIWKMQTLCKKVFKTRHREWYHQVYHTLESYPKGTQYITQLFSKTE